MIKTICATCAIASTAFAVTANAREGYYNYNDEDEVTARGFALEGSFLLGGSFGLNALTTKAEFDEFDEFDSEQSTLLFGAALLFGRFLADDFFLGGALGIDYQSIEDGDYEQSQTTGRIEVMPRYYVQLTRARQAFFVIQGNVGYASISTDDNEGNDREASGFAVGLAGGLAAVLGDDDTGAVVELLVSWRHTFLEADDEEGLNLDIGITAFGVNLGIGTYF